MILKGIKELHRCNSGEGGLECLIAGTYDRSGVTEKKVKQKLFLSWGPHKREF